MTTSRTVVSHLRFLATATCIAHDFLGAFQEYASQHSSLWMNAAFYDCLGILFVL
jgi:hypothetical protein